MLTSIVFLCAATGQKEGGTQLKLVIELPRANFALMKPMRYIHFATNEMMNTKLKRSGKNRESLFYGFSLANTLFFLEEQNASVFLSLFAVSVFAFDTKLFPFFKKLTEKPGFHASSRRCPITSTSPTMRGTTPRSPPSTWIEFWASAEPLPWSDASST